MEQQNVREIKYEALPALRTGQIWGTRSQGVFVVLESRLAEWHGEDRDVYAHIERWYMVRDATPEEVQLQQRGYDALMAREGLRRELGAEGFEYDAATGSLRPTSDATRRLDSYDDRWQPPSTIELTPEQVVIEEQYITARDALQGH